MKSKIIILIIGVFIVVIYGYINYNNTVMTKENDLEKQNYRIDLSTAGIEELKKVPGLGSGKAQKIVDYREINGFSSIEDLKKVEGIGEKVFLKIKDYFILSEKVYEYKKNRININKATKDELIKIPGIGKITADKIIEFRKLKKIKSTEDLKKEIKLSDKVIEQINGVVEF